MTNRPRERMSVVGFIGVDGRSLAEPVVCSRKNRPIETTSTSLQASGELDASVLVLSHGCRAERNRHGSVRLIRNLDLLTNAKVASEVPRAVGLPGRPFDGGNVENGVFDEQLVG